MSASVSEVFQKIGFFAWFYGFKKSYYFIRILRQICHNLVIKKFHCHFAGIVQLASKRKKSTLREKDLLFIL